MLSVIASDLPPLSFSKPQISCSWLQQLWIQMQGFEVLFPICVETK